DHPPEWPGERVPTAVTVYRPGVRPWSVPDHVAAEAFRPRPELVDRRGAEGVCGSEDDGLALCLQHPGQLGDRGGLAGTVDAGHQPDARTLLRVAEGPVGAVEDADELGPEGTSQVLRLQ